MKHRWLLGVVIAVVASAIVTSGIIAVAQIRGPSEENKDLPTKALQPDEISKLPAGTSVDSLQLPYKYGSFRILPAEAAPQRPADAEPPKPGLTVASIDISEGSTLAECQAFPLFFGPNYIPPGYTFSGCSERTILWNDGERTANTYSAGYSYSGYYPIGIGRRALATGETVGVINERPPFKLTLTDLGGVRGIVRHQAPGAKVNGPFQVSLIAGGVLTEIESSGIDLDELLNIARAIAAPQEGRP